MPRILHFDDLIDQVINMSGDSLGASEEAKKNQSKQVVSRKSASVAGMFIGDALGSQNEFLPVRSPSKVVLKLDLHRTFKRVIPMRSHSTFTSKPGQWTDDASMGACLLEVLAEEKGKGRNLLHDFPFAEIMYGFVAWWYQGKNSGRDRSCGLGGVIGNSMRTVLAKLGISEEAASRVSRQEFLSRAKGHDLCQMVREANAQNPMSSGNGSIMRNAVAAVASSVQEAMRLAYQQSLLTTPSQESAQASMLHAFLAYQAIQGMGKDELLSKKNLQAFIAKAKKILGDKIPLETTIKHLCLSKPCRVKVDKAVHQYAQLNWRCALKDYQLNPYSQKKNPGYYGAYVIDGLAIALHVLHNTDSFEEAMTVITLYRGDSDSTGAILGIMAGAVYGYEAIPKKWIHAINQHDMNVTQVADGFQGSPKNFIRQRILEGGQPKFSHSNKDVTKRSSSQPQRTMAGGRIVGYLLLSLGLITLIGSSFFIAYAFPLMTLTAFSVAMTALVTTMVLTLATGVYLSFVDYPQGKRPVTNTPLNPPGLPKQPEVNPISSIGATNAGRVATGSDARLKVGVNEVRASESASASRHALFKSGTRDERYSEDTMAKADEASHKIA